MSLADARARLGLEATYTSADARRSYLRLVKQHKPDQDPEGFRLLREAYELLLQELQDGRAGAGGFAATAAAGGPAEPSAAPLQNAPPEAAQSRVDPWLQGLVDELRALPEGDSQPVIRRLQLAVNERPEMIQPRLWLAQILCEAGRRPEAARILKDGEPYDRPRFFGERAINCPASFTAEEWLELRDLEDPALHIVAASSCNDGAVSTMLARRACDLLNASPLEPIPLEPAFLLAIRCLLTSPPLAREVHAKALAAIEAQGGFRAVREETRFLMVLAGEIFSLPPQLPLRARKALVGGFLAGGLETGAKNLLRALEQMPGAGEQLAPLLQLPILGEALKVVLAEQEEAAAAASQVAAETGGKRVLTFWGVVNRVRLALILISLLIVLLSNLFGGKKPRTRYYSSSDAGAASAAPQQPRQQPFAAPGPQYPPGYDPREAQGPRLPTLPGQQPGFDPRARQRNAGPSGWPNAPGAQPGFPVDPYSRNPGTGRRPPLHGPRPGG